MAMVDPCRTFQVSNRARQPQGTMIGPRRQAEPRRKGGQNSLCRSVELGHLIQNRTGGIGIGVDAFQPGKTRGLDVARGLNAGAHFTRTGPGGGRAKVAVIDLRHFLHQVDPVHQRAGNPPQIIRPALWRATTGAPGFDDDALEILTTRPKWKKNVRLMAIDSDSRPENRLELRPIYGGILVQDADTRPVDSQSWKVVTDQKPTDELLLELEFGWNLIRFVKSNAITLSKDQALVGVGAGQMSRVDSVNISIEKAADRAAGSVLSSDAFFPFPDSIELAAKAGIAAIIQPGGSVKDDEVIAACNQHGIPMVFTGNRHFKH